MLNLLRICTLAALFFGIQQPLWSQELEVYKLGPGDRVRVIVYGEKDLSGEYEVDGTGSLTLPLVGEVNVGQKSVREAEQTVITAYLGDYLINPRVNVEILNYRPVFILGEVKTPGNYPYISGMTVLQAVTVAGGYTYRAKKSNMTLRRMVGKEEQEIDVTETTRIFPGDILTVQERLF